MQIDRQPSQRAGTKCVKCGRCDALRDLQSVYAIHMDRKRRILDITPVAAFLDGAGHPPEWYVGRVPEDVWRPQEAHVEAYWRVLKRQERDVRVEQWEGQGGLRRIVRAARVPTCRGVLIVGEDLTARVRLAALEALLGAPGAVQLGQLDRIVPLLLQSDATLTSVAAGAGMTLAQVHDALAALVGRH